jgi:1-acyl-sn-glycerol-3-phosphate acyltransferase
MRAIKFFYECLAMLVGLGSLATLCLFGLPIAIFLLSFPSRIRIIFGRRLIRRTLAIYLWILKTFCFVRIQCDELEAVELRRPLILIANHPSLLDAVILLSKLPHATCIMKAGLRGNLFFGPMAHLAGYISNDDPARLIRKACEELKNGSIVIIFPEGTRTTRIPVNAFGETTAFISMRSGVSIQTVLIRYNKFYLGKAWPIWRKPTLPLCIDLKLGSKFSADGNRYDVTQRLESYYRAILSAIII